MNFETAEKIANIVAYTKKDKEFLNHLELYGYVIIQEAFSEKIKTLEITDRAVIDSIINYLKRHIKEATEELEKL